VIAAHNTWSQYWNMLRAWKVVNYEHVAHSSFHSRQASFSSYFGALASLDDWYTLLPTRLVVTETTGHCLNDTLQGEISPKSLVTGLRAILANRMSRNGAEWASTFSRQNSGTQNNQWIILDEKRIHADRLESGALTILEQMPGTIVWDDLTDVLAQNSYWPSFNCPYFPIIRRISQYERLAEDAKTGFYFSHSKTPRSRLLARDHVKVVDMQSMQALMRYANYSDPIAENCSRYVIAARYELAPEHCVWWTQLHGTDLAEGALDAKVAHLKSSGGIMEGSVAISSPPTDGVPVFEWSRFFPGVAHEGQPDRFDFAWQRFGSQPSSPVLVMM